MIKDLLKWVAPGVVTVLGGTVAALAMATPTLVSDIERAGRSALASPEMAWADISLDGRDVVLAGTVDTLAKRDSAVDMLAAIPAVRTVTDSVVIAPLDTPYRLNVSVEDGAISLSGSVPNADLLNRLSASPGLASADLSIRSGHPDKSLWWDGASFLLEKAAHLQSGHLQMSGLELTLSGTARSQRDLGELEIALASMPPGLALSSAAIEPVRVSPYTWSASFDGNRIAISGHAPAQQVVERLRMADVSGLPIATGLSLASGAPDGFADLSRTLVEQLARLEYGEASIVDGTSRISGMPPSVEAAQLVAQALSGTGSIVQLAPARVDDYWVSVTRQEGGVLVFDGYAPDDATRNRFADTPEADVSFLKLGSGAPEIYPVAVDFGLTLLSRLSEGRFALRDDVLSVSGIAETPSDYSLLQAALAEDVPQGIELGEVAVQAPAVASYTFTLRRMPNGNMVMSGFLPSPDVEARIMTALGAGATSSVSYGSGEPLNFLASAEQAAAFLPRLSEGQISFDGASWAISGTPASEGDKASIETEFALAGLVQSGWVLNLSPVATAPAPVSAYTWSAERLADGSFLFTGHVPAQSLRDYLAVRVATRVADTTTVAAGAPADFAAEARAATDALLQLQQGRAAFDGTTWTFSGTAADAVAREAALGIAVAALGISPDSAVTASEPTAPEPYIWSATKSDSGAVTFTGFVPAEALQRFLAVRGGAQVSDETVLRADAPEDFAQTAREAMDILALMTEGTVSFDGSAWSASGEGSASDSPTKASALVASSAASWTLDIQPAPAVAEMPSDETPPAPETPPAADPAPAIEPSAASRAALAQCQARLAELSAHNAILFQSGAALIAESAAAELDAFAQTLASCPDTRVYVEGHTDSDGDERLNLALSVARAEAVVSALIERGVALERLYAVGYGESQPVADNATADGKRRNRRIVITVEPAK